MIDLFAMLAWLVERENAGGPSLSGQDVLHKAASLDPEPAQGRNSVVNALRDLKRRDWISWRFQSWPNGPSEPQVHHVGDGDIQHVYDITVTTDGRRALADHQPAVPTTQINIINSTIGQIAGRDLANLNLLVIIDAAERSLDKIEAPDEEKEPARRALAKMREALTTVGTGAAGALLAAAVKRAFGLP